MSVCIFNNLDAGMFVCADMRTLKFYGFKIKQRLKGVALEEAANER